MAKITPTPRLPLPPCWCGMPLDLAETRAHRRWHRAWVKAERQRERSNGKEARAAQWVAEHTRVKPPTVGPRGLAGNSGAYVRPPKPPAQVPNAGVGLPIL